MKNKKDIENELLRITQSNFVVNLFQSLCIENQQLKQDIAVKDSKIAQLDSINKNWSKLFKLQNQELRTLEEQLKTR